MSGNETRDALAELISSSLHDSRGDDPRDSSAYVAGMILDALPKLGWIKATPRIVTTVAELDELPAGTVLVDEFSVWQSNDYHWWFRIGMEYPRPAADVLKESQSVLIAAWLPDVTA